MERTIPPGLGANLEVSFADDTNGLVLSAGSEANCQSQVASLWQTADGAASWQKLTPTGIADALCKRGLTSADATHSLFTAWSQNAAPVIYRSADAGRAWTASHPLPDPPGFTTQGGGIVLIPGRPRAFGSVVLLPAGDGRQQAGYVFRSTDGGATWTYASTTTFEGGIAFVTPSRWLQLIAPGYSKETTDSGASWHASSSDYGQAAPTAPEVVFGDATVGYATVRGGIQRTIDGGAHWTPLKTPGTA